ncbi:MAG: SET domain-containing protein [Eubacteriales bacterium]
MEQNLFADIIDNIKGTYIAPSGVHGMGLFASEEMAQGICLGELDGQVMPWALFDKISGKMQGETFQEAFFMEWNALSKDTLLTRPFRTKYSFINHNRIPNLCLKTEPLRVLTLQKISAHEELFLDYRKEDLSDAYLQGHGKTYL